MSQRRVDLERRHATKRHPCLYCKRGIKPGQEYCRIAVVRDDGTSDGEFVVVKFHADGGNCGGRRTRKRTKS